MEPYKRIYHVWDGGETEEEGYFANKPDAFEYAKHMSEQSDSEWDVTLHETELPWKELFFRFANEKGWSQNTQKVGTFVNGKNVMKNPPLVSRHRKLA